MVIQAVLHSQNYSLNHYEAGQNSSSVSSHQIPNKTVLQHLLSFSRGVQSKSKISKGRNRRYICNRQIHCLADTRTGTHRRCRLIKQVGPSHRTRNLKWTSKTRYISKHSPRVFRNISADIFSKNHETNHAPTPQVTVVSLSEENDHHTTGRTTDFRYIVKHCEVTPRVVPQGISKLNGRTSGRVVTESSSTAQFQLVSPSRHLKLDDNCVSFWNTPLQTASSDPFVLDLHSLHLENQARIPSVTNWPTSVEESARSADQWYEPNSSFTGCYSNNNANATQYSALAASGLTISASSRSYPVIIDNSYRTNRGLALEKDSDCCSPRHATCFHPQSLLDADLNPDHSRIQHQNSEHRSCSSKRLQASRCLYDRFLYSSVGSQARSDSLELSRRAFWTAQYLSESCLHSEDPKVNERCKACDLARRKSLSYISQKDMGCIQSIFKSKVSPDRSSHHCVIVEDIQAAIDRVPTEIEEKSDIVLRYKTPYFRASAQVVIPPILRKETWTIGWIQACDSMKFINEYGNLGSSSWEIPALKERKISAVSDSDGVSYPWYGNTTEIASIEGPTDTSRSILLRMNDNFHPSVTWDIPVSEGSEAHLTHIVRDQSFTTWLAAVNQTTGRLEVLRTVKWHFFLEIDVDPTEELGKRAHIVSPAEQRQPIILKSTNDPVYLSHNSGTRSESSDERQNIFDRRIRNGGDNNSNNHSNFIPKSALVRPSANNAQTLVWRPTRNPPIVVVPPKEVYRENNEVIWFSNANGQGPNVKILSKQETTQLSKSMDR